jgi:hypothetical protein
MNMVAQEMASSCEDEDEDIVSQDFSSPSRAMAEIFYAQMNGEEIDASYRDYVEELPVDDEVCAAGALTLPDDGMRSSSRRRSSVESTSKASRSTHSRSSSRSSASSDADDEDTLLMSIGEIQKCVMENMPEEVKNKIPKQSSGHEVCAAGALTLPDDGMRSSSRRRSSVESTSKASRSTHSRSSSKSSASSDADDQDTLLMSIGEIQKCVMMENKQSSGHEVCAAGALTLPDDGMMSSSRRRSSVESTSKASRSTHSRSSSKSSASSDADDQDTLLMSIDEIQKCVMMENMPEEVKNKIPKQPSGQISANIGADATRKSLNEDIMAQEEDDATVFSDITESTGCPKVVVNNGTAAPFTPEEEKWDEELCPTINKGSSHTRRSHNSHDTSASCSRPAMSFRTDATGAIIATKVYYGVKFDSVDVRYYERVLDINPAVTEGAAIGIGWRYNQGDILSVDDWELQRAEGRRISDFALSRDEREGILKDLGYTEKDIYEATRIILKAKKRRKTTIRNLGDQNMEEAVESASRRVKEILSFGSKKRLVKA